MIDGIAVTLRFGAPALVPLHNGGFMGRELRAYAGAPPATGGFLSS